MGAHSSSASFCNNRNLQDLSPYRLSSASEFQIQHRKVKLEWTREAKLTGLNRTAVARLKIDLHVCPVLHLLIKTHFSPVIN